MLSQIVIWRLQLFDNVWCTTSISCVELHLAMSLVHVINVVLMLVVLHCLPVMLVLENLCEDSFCAGGDASVVDSTSTIILNAHSSSMNCIELVLCIIGSRGSLPSGRSRIGSTLCN